MDHRASTVTDDDVRDIARDADTHPTSVIRRLAGLPVRGRSGARIDRALAARGLLTSTDAPSA